MHPHALILAGEATKHAVNIVSQRLDHHHHQAISKLRSNVLEMMSTKVTALQIKVVHEQSMFILNMFAKQADHYMKQQAQLEKEQLGGDGAFNNAKRESRLNEIDEQLKNIREASLLLHSATAAFILEAGRQIIGFSGDFSMPLPSQLADNSVIAVQ